MRVLIACEFSGTVRRAFRHLGHDAWSCDLLPAEDGGPHIEGDVRYVLKDGWDLLIGHPPCTHLATSGARWFKDKLPEQQAALDFVARLLEAPVPQIAIENPRSIISTWLRPIDQEIQPHEFGHPEFKTTWLWPKGLPALVPTNPIPLPARDTPEWIAWNRVHRATPGQDRWKERSRTYEGIAQAMAAQWGGRLVYQGRLFPISPGDSQNGPGIDIAPQIQPGKQAVACHSEPIYQPAACRSAAAI